MRYSDIYDLFSIRLVLFGSSYSIHFILNIINYECRMQNHIVKMRLTNWIVWSHSMHCSSFIICLTHLFLIRIYILASMISIRMKCHSLCSHHSSHCSNYSCWLWLGRFVHFLHSCAIAIGLNSITGWYDVILFALQNDYEICDVNNC